MVPVSTRAGIFAALVGLLAAAPADAALTLSEKANVKIAAIAGQNLDSAFSSFGQLVAVTDAIKAATPAHLGRMNLMWTRFVSTYNKMHRGITYLEGVNPNNNPPSPAYIGSGKTQAFNTEFASMTCSVCVAGALKLDFDAIAADGAQSGAVQAIAAAGAASMLAFNCLMGLGGGACTGVTPIDSTLAYASPLPDEYGISDSTLRDFGALSSTDKTLENRPFTGGPSAAVIGPHGNYVATLQDLAFSLGQMTGGIDSIRLAWCRIQTSTCADSGESDYSSAEYIAFGAIPTNMASIMGKLRHMLVAAADVPINDTDCGFTPFHLVARTMEGLLSNTVGLPFFYKTMADAAFDTLMEAMASRTVARGKFIGTAAGTPAGWHPMTLAAWRYSDGAMFMILEFPIRRTFTLRSLRSQFAAPNTAHGVTVCPDGTNPSVTITVPSTGATISRMAVLTATATDNIRVTQVTFDLDGPDGIVVIGRPATIAPFTIEWDTREFPNGTFTLTATAYDAAGNTAAHAITVTIAN